MDMMPDDPLEALVESTRKRQIGRKTRFSSVNSEWPAVTTLHQAKQRLLEIDSIYNNAMAYLLKNHRDTEAIAQFHVLRGALASKISALDGVVRYLNNDWGRNA